MSRTYLRAASLTAVGLLAAGLSQESAVRTLFDSAAVPEEHYTVLAQPIGRAQWKLLVLEQIQAQPRCWRSRQDGLVEPSLNRFNFSGICKRYLDSNGYSLRSGGQDLGTGFRFRVKRSGTLLKLEALDPQHRAPLLVGQAATPSRRDPNGFVALHLEPGWALERRVYQGRPLNHLYFAHQEPVNRLLAMAAAAGHRSGFSRLLARMAPITPPPLPAAPASRRRTTRLASTAPIRRQVIPHIRCDKPSQCQLGERTDRG